MTLMDLWVKNKDACRPVGQVIAAARAGMLAGVEPLESGFGFRVADEKAALAAMSKGQA